MFKFKTISAVTCVFVLGVFGCKGKPKTEQETRKKARYTTISKLKRKNFGIISAYELGKRGGGDCKGLVREYAEGAMFMLFKCNKEYFIVLLMDQKRIDKKKEAYLASTISLARIFLHVNLSPLAKIGPLIKPATHQVKGEGGVYVWAPFKVKFGFRLR